MKLMIHEVNVQREKESMRSQGLAQFIKFALVGVSNTLISYVLYVLFLAAMQGLNIFPTYDYLIAQVTSFLLSVLWAFYWNRRFVFNVDDDDVVWWKALIKTYVSYSFTGLFLGSVLLVVWVEFLGISKYFAPILTLLITVPLNFILNKYWAFKKGTQSNGKGSNVHIA